MRLNAFVQVNGKMLLLSGSRHLKIRSWVRWPSRCMKCSHRSSCRWFGTIFVWVDPCKQPSTTSLRGVFQQSSSTLKLNSTIMYSLVADLFSLIFVFAYALIVVASVVRVLLSSSLSYFIIGRMAIRREPFGICFRSHTSRFLHCKFNFIFLDGVNSYDIMLGWFRQ